MKSEERHELKSNDLVTLINRIKPGLEKHSNKIIFGALAVLVIGVISVVAMKKNESARTAGWSEMANARSSEDYANIVDEYPGTSVARFAKLNQASALYENGLQFMFTDKASGLSDMKKSQELYKSLLEDKETTLTIRERALFGLARCQESTSGENTQEAIDSYEQLLKEFPETVFQAKAEERIKVLATDESKSFYSWFQKQNPKPVDRTKPQDGDDPGSEDEPEDDDKKEAAENSDNKTEQAGDKKEEPSSKEKVEDKKPETKLEGGPQLGKPSPENKETGKKEAEKKEASTEKKEAPEKENTDKKNADKENADKK